MDVCAACEQWTRGNRLLPNKFRLTFVDDYPHAPGNNAAAPAASRFYDRLEWTKQWPHYLLPRISAHYARRICLGRGALRFHGHLSAVQDPGSNPRVLRSCFRWMLRDRIASPRIINRDRVIRSLAKRQTVISLFLVIRHFIGKGCRLIITAQWLTTSLS